MRLADVYDTKRFIAISEGNAESDVSVKYRAIALNFFKKLKELPTKYDLHNATQYVLPKEILAHMPEYSKETIFPRARVLPEESVKTKWEMFAARKGIVRSKNKTGGRVYDEVTREYAPAFGRGSKNDLDRNWLIEVKDHEDPMIDRHSLLKENKKKNKRAQKIKEYRNLKRTDRIKCYERRDRDNELM
ncbi:regulator of ribosome biosynthesis [Nematocida parisii]|nr:regulator of ribosome biosynthesis [Nematocida parisii]KAI5126479.1 regulator of ribosome biosynthesis [Nematocida parisii]KAI5140696.1 regulator of ribosome biosynthesis [Nematocida parisii]KAI5142927.1 regulator of ribosome biosynthesis [Nematocida parisii]KAI5153215.1 regulator of ribosome biosynthesis [Nematocida parisii]